MYATRMISRLYGYLTLVLNFCSDFFMMSTTKGSDFPIKSVAGKSCADITVTERTPLTITSFFVWKLEDLVGSATTSCLRDFSSVVNLKSRSKGFIIWVSQLNGQYKSSRCTYNNLYLDGTTITRHLATLKIL